MYTYNISSKFRKEMVRAQKANSFSKDSRTLTTKKPITLEEYFTKSHYDGTTSYTYIYIYI